MAKTKKPLTPKRSLSPARYKRERAAHVRPVRAVSRRESKETGTRYRCGIDKHRHQFSSVAMACMAERLVQARRIAAAMALYENGHKPGCLRAIVPDEAQAHCDCGLLAYVSEAKTFHNTERGM